MELKLKLKYLGVVLFLFATMIVIDWYKNIDYSSVYDEKIEEDILSSDYHLYAKRWKLDNNKRYFLQNTNSVKKTKSNIPFIFNREILSSTTPEIIMYTHQ